MSKTSRNRLNSLVYRILLSKIPQGLLGKKCELRIVMRYFHWKRQHGLCHWCERKTIWRRPQPNDQQDADPTLEHVLPRSKGGKIDVKDTAMACYRCNFKRLAHDCHPFKLKKQQGVPVKVDLNGDELQVLALSLAKLAIERTGWGNYLREIAMKLEIHELYDNLRELHKIDGSTIFLWFGVPWNKICCTEDNRVDMPSGTNCTDCGNLIQENESGIIVPHLEPGVPIATGRSVYHLKCFLENVGVEN